ncbi:periplasmic/membrane thiol peroxidase-like protein [Ramlibacter tataouinensis TTB310]|uniref:Periplasmic/membrane thiol peroxidase-like protein n=2 Tax=Ramlibacter tataouinensis TaxID=94132 RepID=F5XVK7_RAMTT|nr:periplasmic/membrane thiol peroxidase-like protein [Ramlibacter tataouinensis TTB310]
MLRRTLIAASLTALAATAQAAATVGQPAPEFTLKDAAGKTVRLSDFRGKHVVLEWTNPGCPFVQKHYNSGNMPATQKAATDQGVVWLSVNSTARDSGDWLEPAKLMAWKQERKAAPTAVLMDEEGTVGKSYGARTTPHLYIVDPQGRLVYAGGIDSIPSANAQDIPRATNYVRQGLGEALSGKPLSVSTTRPYGCSVKYKS